MAKQKDNQLECIYSSYVRIRDGALNTCQRRCMIERSGERGSEISVLAERHHDDDDDIYIYVCVCMFIHILMDLHTYMYGCRCMCSYTAVFTHV